MSLFPQFDVGSQGSTTMPLAGASRAAENQAFLKGMNADTDQVASMLNHNQNAELFDALMERDKSQAAEFAVHHQEIQTHALHDTDDEAFQQDIRLRLTGVPVA
jgi:hypothetical protein